MPTQAPPQTTKAAVIPALTAAPVNLLQRKCACGGNPGPSGECEECRKKRTGMLQRSALNMQPTLSVPPIVNEVLRSSGQPLDADTRALMEPRFGHDFSKVRVHTDARAAESASMVNALAYTVGHNIVFGSQQYIPRTNTGRKLIAHELTHTIQQGPLSPERSASLSISDPHDPSEQEAERASSVVLSGQAFLNTSGERQHIARQRHPVIDEDEEGLPPPTPDLSELCSNEENACDSRCCQQSRCSERELVAIPDDIVRAIDYANTAITALSQSPLADNTVRALDWYFSDHSENTVNEVRRRLGCILECLQDTQSNNRFSCNPDYAGTAAAYVCGVNTSICTHVQTDICVAPSYIHMSPRARAELMVHECAHRVGMSIRARRLPDIYQSSLEFLFLDTDTALRNSDSFALFAGAITEGIPLTMLIPIVGITGGFAAPERGSATWRASLYYGAEFQSPVLGIFNPTLGIGLTVIGETTSGTGSGAVTSPTSFLISILPGVRIGNARPGSAGGGYMSLFGGPALAIGNSVDVGAEAGIGFGYRWRWLDFSAGVGYTYDPTREAGMEDLVTGSVSLTFLPLFSSF